jgi:hypothetical protein
MDFNELLDIIKVLVGVIGVSVLLYFYFTNPGFRSVLNKGFNFLPFLLTFAKRFVTDTEGKFDSYDALELLERVSSRIKETVEDPSNVEFVDVEEEVFTIVRDELRHYQKLEGVPDLNDPEIRVQVKVVFDSIKKAVANENRTGDDS